MSKRSGGYAFPVKEDKETLAVEYGMTLRDWFAGQALNGLVQSATYGGELKRIFDSSGEIVNSGEPKETPQHYTARIALSLADAMIEARNT